MTAWWFEINTNPGMTPLSLVPEQFKYTGGSYEDLCRIFGRGGPVSQNIPIVIGGPTASGKSQLAIDLALEFNGVVINADASQVYKSIPVIAASPSAADKQKVPHRLYASILMTRLTAMWSHGWRDAAAEIRKARQQAKTPVIVRRRRPLSR